MVFLLRPYVRGTCCSTRWWLRLVISFIPISDFRHTPTLITILHVDLIRLLSSMPLRFLKFFLDHKFLLLLPEPMSRLILLLVNCKLVIIGSTLVLEVLACASIPETLAQLPLQHNLHGVFQQRLANWNSQIWIAMAKSGVFKKHSPQH